MASLGTLQAVAALADSVRRVEAARALARHVGADDLIIFVWDPQVRALLPADGFPKTLPRGLAWQELVKRAVESGEIREAELPYPVESTVALARCLPCGKELALVFLGGSPKPALLEETREAAPFLSAVLRTEQRLAAVGGEAAVARSSAERAEALTRSLSASQAELREVLSALHASEQWLSTTLLSIGDAVIATDAAGRIKFMNSIAESLTGWSAEEASSKPLAEIFRIVSKPDRAEVDSPVERVIRDGTVTGLANRTLLIRRDGTALAIDHSAAPIRDTDRRLIGVVLVFRDVTERRNAESLIYERRRQAELGAEIGLALTSTEPLEVQLHRVAETIVEHLDAAFARIWTLSPLENVLELKASAGLYTHLDGPHSRIEVGAFKIGLIAKERRPHLTNNVLNDPRVSDKEWARREGMVAFAGYPLVVEGQLVGVMALFARHPLSDTTLEALGSVASSVALGIYRAKSDQARSLLLDSLERLNTIATEISAELDTEKLVQRITDAATELSGAELGAFVADIEPGRSGGTPREALSGLLKGDYRNPPPFSSHLVVPIVRPSGKVCGRLLLWHQKPNAFDPRIERLMIGLASHAAVAMDNARLYEMRRRAEEEATKHAHFERELIGIVSHDLRNPLNVMMMAASLLLRKETTDPSSSKTLARILSSGERASRMISDLLDFTRARLGKGIPIQRKGFNAHDLAHQLLEETKLAHPDRSIELLASGDGSGDWDRERVAQVIINLLENAIAYSPPDSPVLLEIRGEGTELIIEVRNSGEPIPSELLPVIFEPMQRGTTSMSRTGRSVGLGLYIVSQVVAAHGGRIEVRSSAEEGTAFTARLPRS